jgi:hypothetical protein
MHSGPGTYVQRISTAVSISEHFSWSQDIVGPACAPVLRRCRHSWDIYVCVGLIRHGREHEGRAL